MNTSNETVPELEVPERLGYLIKYCEKSCVAECCGVDAFDFSPLHVASCISAYTGAIDEQELAAWNGLIDEFERNLGALKTAGGAGLICVISSMNQLFTDEAIRALIAELRTSVAASPEVLALSNRLETPTHAWKLMKDFEDQQRPKLP
jgi:hypothetical protein